MCWTEKDLSESIFTLLLRSVLFEKIEFFWKWTNNNLEKERMKHNFKTRFSKKVHNFKTLFSKKVPIVEAKK